MTPDIEELKFTPKKGVILYLKFFPHFQSKINSKKRKTTHVRSKNNPIFRVRLGVKRTLFQE